LPNKARSRLPEVDVHRPEMVMGRGKVISVYRITPRQPWRSGNDDVMRGTRWTHRTHPDALDAPERPLDATDAAGATRVQTTGCRRLSADSGLTCDTFH
jgi:hypothetical protein